MNSISHIPILALLLSVPVSLIATIIPQARSTGTRWLRPWIGCAAFRTTGPFPLSIQAPRAASAKELSLSGEAQQYSTRLAALACMENSSILEASYIQHATDEGPDSVRHALATSLEGSHDEGRKSIRAGHRIFLEVHGKHIRPFPLVTCKHVLRTTSDTHKHYIRGVYDMYNMDRNCNGVAYDGYVQSHIHSMGRRVSYM